MVAKFELHFCSLMATFPHPAIRPPTAFIPTPSFHHCRLRQLCNHLHHQRLHYHCLLRHRGMRHTSTALYFYGASKKSLHKPRVTFSKMLFQISYSPNYYQQLLCSQFFSKTYQKILTFTFGIKIVLFLKSLLYQYTIVKIVHLHNNTLIY